ncbi:unnamed protein product [Gemmataceae bacterium]|nr:unnamed protein product [Gemmataceae bacterium]VTT97589.1 unnamed protein product [Gemmataceae bacterium]
MVRLSTSAAKPNQCGFDESRVESPCRATRQDTTDERGGDRTLASSIRLFYPDKTADLTELVAIREGAFGAFLSALSRPGTPEFERVWQGMVNLGYDPAKLINDVQFLGEAATGRFPVPAAPEIRLTRSVPLNEAGGLPEFEPFTHTEPAPDPGAELHTGGDRGHFVLGVQISDGQPVPIRTEPSGVPSEESFISDADTS